MKKLDDGMPMYFTRFEELISHPEPELIGVFKFLLNSKDTEGTVIEQRIQDALEHKDKTQTYKMKKDGHKHYAKDEDMYTDVQKKHLFTTLFDFLWFFGYWKSDDPEHE